MVNLTESRSSSYSVLTFVTDELRGTTLPVGIALWSSQPESVRVRLTSDKENVKGIKKEWLPYVELLSSQLKEWIQERQLPYAHGNLKPNSDEWWRHLRNLLVHRIRVSDPKAIDCRNAEEEVELLYEAVVQPERAEKERRETVDRVISKSLGSLARRFTKGTLPGFEGRPVPVKRFVDDDQKVVILEGVNLASANAEDDTDALVSRLQRIKESNGPADLRKQMITLVGYLSSPNGLNGEAALVDWIEKKGEAQTFDLVREREQFVGKVELEVCELRTTKQRALRRMQ